MSHVQENWGAQDPWGDRTDLGVQDGWGAQDCWGNSEPQPHPRGLFEDVFYYIHHDGRESDAFDKLERVLAVSPQRLRYSYQR